MSRRDIAKVRMNLGLLVRRVREQTKLKRRKISALSGVPFLAIVYIEHGFPWENRSESEQLIRFYKMPAEQEVLALQLLDLCFTADAADSGVSVLITPEFLGELLKQTKPERQHWPKPRRPRYRRLPRKSRYRNSRLH